MFVHIQADKNAYFFDILKRMAKKMEAACPEITDKHIKKTRFLERCSKARYQRTIFRIGKKSGITVWHSGSGIETLEKG